MKTFRGFVPCACWRGFRAVVEPRKEKATLPARRNFERNSCEETTVAKAPVVQTAFQVCETVEVTAAVESQQSLQGIIQDITGGQDPVHDTAGTAIGKAVSHATATLKNDHQPSSESRINPLCEIETAPQQAIARVDVVKEVKDNHILTPSEEDRILSQETGLVEEQKPHSTSDRHSSQDTSTDQESRTPECCADACLAPTAQENGHNVNVQSGSSAGKQENGEGERDGTKVGEQIQVDGGSLGTLECQNILNVETEATVGPTHGHSNDVNLSSNSDVVSNTTPEGKRPHSQEKAESESKLQPAHDTSELTEPSGKVQLTPTGAQKIEQHMADKSEDGSQGPQGCFGAEESTKQGKKPKKKLSKAKGKKRHGKTGRR
ncbi:hypothetical protein cyc_00897 [Cyclospora cayetanensis]|uniref:Uncharacterized protein n=1 Tax=Cyclospora cayetanensis TaxID=88456 RepID=A0A1D3D2J3_9EIME|nr:hypothetical protein cyc_00897 [Cyclospora cayetanensis]